MLMQRGAVKCMQTNVDLHNVSVHATNVAPPRITQVPVQTTLDLFRALTTHRTRPKGAGGATIFICEMCEKLEMRRASNRFIDRHPRPAPAVAHLFVRRPLLEKCVRTYGGSPGGGPAAGNR
jgi:hypothetical protein